MDDRNQLYRKLRELAKQRVDLVDANASEEIPNPQAAYLDKLKQHKELLQSLSSSGEKFSSTDIVPDTRSLKEVSQEELLDLYDRLNSMHPSDRKKYSIGRGAFKEAFQLPDSDLILKASHGRIFKRDPEDEILKDYLAHKMTNKHLSKTPYADVIETPTLIKRPDVPAMLAQRQLITDGVQSAFPEDFNLLDENIKNRLRKLEDESSDIVRNLDDVYAPHDVHSGNVGLDPKTLKTKFFDIMASPIAVDDADQAFGRLKRILKELKSPRVLRTAVGAGLMGGLNLASEAADSSEEGSGAEHGALLRESDLRKVRNANIKKNPAMQEFYDKMDADMRLPKSGDLIQDVKKFPALRARLIRD